MINGKGFKICCGIIEAVSRFLTRESAENHETLGQDSQVSRPRTDLGTSRI
jgi:hypothetical protein